VGEHSKPFKARVDQMCVEADLALLKVTDDGLEEFEERVKPLRLRMALPHLQDRLQVRMCLLAVKRGQVWKEHLLRSSCVLIGMLGK